MQVRTYIDKRGRIVLPSQVKKQLNYKPGDRVILRIIDNNLHVVSLTTFITEIQKSLRINEDDKKNMLEDFIESRRLDAKLEEEKYKRMTESYSDSE